MIRHSKLIYSLISICIVLVLIGFYFLLDSAVTWSKMTDPKWNDFGSFLGGLVSNIWSLAGTCILIVAFLLQKNQLEVQQKELGLNTHELQLMREESSKQSNIWEQQKFDTNVLAMIGNVSNLFLNLQDGTQTGRTVISSVYYSLSRSPTEVNWAFGKVGHIFLNVSLILQYIEGAKVDSDKAFYAKLTLAQLTEIELDILHRFISDSVFMPTFKPKVREILIKYVSYNGRSLDYGNIA